MHLEYIKIWLQRGGLLMSMFLLTIMNLQAQDNDALRLRSHSTMFGIGHNNQLDTYLSPLEYTGTEIRFIQENVKPTRLLQQKVSMQNLIQANFSYTKSPSDDGKYLSGMIDWNIGLHYCWPVTPSLRILAGPQIGLHAGGIYNTRNGNNPAQARLQADLNASGMAIYTFRLWNKTMQARYQGDLLIAGMMFSPEYGQSYYELFSLGNGGHNVCFCSPFSAVSYNQLLTLDIPMKNAKFRIGIENIIRQSKANDIKTHDWTWLFLVGYVKQFSLIKP